MTRANVWVEHDSQDERVLAQLLDHFTRSDWLRSNRVERWVGGVRIESARAVNWRFDAQAGVVLAWRTMYRAWLSRAARPDVPSSG